MKYFSYILECANGDRYFGHTNNLSRRIQEHTSGKVISTRRKRPINLVYFEEFTSRKDAYHREHQFKNGKTRKNTINELIQNFDPKMSRV